MLAASLTYIDRWIKNGTGDPEDRLSFFSRKREILFSKILLSAAAIIIFIILKDIFVMRVAMSVAFDVAILLIILLAFWMVRTGYQRFAKGFFLILMNGFTAFYASALPVDRGILLYFFPLITMAFAIFDDEEVYFRLTFILLPALLLLVLIATDFEFPGGFKIATSPHGKYNLVINAVITSLMIIFFVEFMMRANRESERLLRELADDVQRKKDDIEKVNRELDRFVYSTSHDLRAPLSSIKGLIRVALNETDTSQYRNYFGMINDRTNKLEDFINEIIDYSRNARMEINPEPTYIPDVLKEVIANLQFVENAERIRFDVEDSAGIVQLDKSRLRIVINNLVSNAVKYQNTYADESWVNITSTLENGFCCLSLSDNGIGIHADLVKRIFEMFYRATEKSTGSGLGLYIVKEIITRMNGSITVRSEFGKGTEFVIRLPVYG